MPFRDNHEYTEFRQRILTGQIQVQTSKLSNNPNILEIKNKQDEMDVAPVYVLKSENQPSVIRTNNMPETFKFEQVINESSDAIIKKA